MEEALVVSTLAFVEDAPITPKIAKPFAASATSAVSAVSAASSSGSAHAILTNLYDLIAAFGFAFGFASGFASVVKVCVHIDVHLAQPLQPLRVTSVLQGEGACNQRPAIVSGAAVRSAIASGVDVGDAMLRRAMARCAIVSGDIASRNISSAP